MDKIVRLRDRLPTDHVGYVNSLKDSAGVVVTPEVRESAVAVVDALAKNHPDAPAYTSIYFSGGDFTIERVGDNGMVKTVDILVDETNELVCLGLQCGGGEDFVHRTFMTPGEAASWFAKSS